MDNTRLQMVLNDFQSKSVLVIGDLMLDQYYWGSTDRISPEAPVPIVRINSINNLPGGAGNVALNLAKLNCKTWIAGLVGDDEQGRILKSALTREGINTDCLVASTDRPTTVKTRIIAQSQQILRTDREDTDPIEFSLLEQINNKILAVLPQIDGIIIADYNKGFLTTELINMILVAAEKESIAVYVDPKRVNFFSYHKVRLFKPNKSEFYNAIGNRFSDTSLEIGGKQLFNEIESEILMITLGQEGISLFFDDEYHSIPTRARQVHDVSGAGDTVIAVFTLSDLAGASPIESAQIANLAAGRVVAEVGAVPITTEMLVQLINKQTDLV